MAFRINDVYGLAFNNRIGGIEMMKWNLFAIMILAALFAVSCGDEDPSSDVGAACTTDGEKKCEGDLALTCQSGSWTAFDCAGIGKTCVMNGAVAECGGGGTTDTPATENDTPATDTDTPATGNCGNDKTDTGEACDGDAKDCTTIAGGGYTGGWAECKADCSGYDETACVSGGTDNPVTDSDTPATGGCGDGTWDQAESQQDTEYETCDPSDTQDYSDGTNTINWSKGLACATFSALYGGTEHAGDLTGGNVNCTANCTFDISECTITKEAYGTIAANFTSNFILDYEKYASNGYGNPPSQGYNSTIAFTGTYGTGKSMAVASANQSSSLAARMTKDNNGAALAQPYIMVDSSSLFYNQSAATVVMAIGDLYFPTDAISNGLYGVDPIGGLQFVIIEVTGDVVNQQLQVKTQCLAAMGFGGNVSVTNAFNTTQMEGGALAFNSQEIKVFHPTDMPLLGDISGQMSIDICAK